MAEENIELPQYSMFSKTPVYKLPDATVVFGLMQPAVVPHPTDELWTVGSSGAARLDLLSDDFYNTPALWWVIAAVNNIIDPLLGIPQGTRIRVPTKERLASEGILGA